jgi:hypothetical protein
MPCLAGCAGRHGSTWGVQADCLKHLQDCPARQVPAGLVKQVLWHHSVAESHVSFAATAAVLHCRCKLR